MRELRAGADARDALAWLGRRLAWEDLMAALTEPQEPPAERRPLARPA